MSDDELLTRAREGDAAAYGELWRRHAGAGTTVARRLASADVADDLVAEAFARILSTIQRGSGPVSGFRPYLITTIRNVARRWAEKPRAVQVDDFDQFEDPGTLDDPAIAALDRTLTLTAFRSLPERWQTVLWYSEVEGMDPHEIAPFLGMTPNATAALSYRARAGLREAWLQAHLKDDSTAPGCRWTTDRLSGYVSGKLTERERKAVADHLETCTKCTIVAGELDHIGSRLAFVLVPLLVGSGVAASILASGSEPASAATAAPPLPAKPASRSFSRRPKTRSSHANPARWIIAGGATLVLAATAVVAIAATQHSAPATSNAAAGITTSPAPTAPETSSPSPAPSATTTPPPIVPVVPVPHVAFRPKTPAPPIPPVTAAVAVTSPVTGLLTNSAATTLSGTGVPGALVVIREGGATDGTATVDPAGNWSIVVTLADGSHSLAVTQSTAASSSSTPVSLSITVDTTAPAAPLVTTPVDNAALQPFTIAGTAEPGATVTISDGNGTLLASVIADSTGAWASGQLSGLAPTVTSVRVVQTDPAGNVSPTTVVGPIAMTPTIVSPAVGAQYASGSTVTVSVKGWPGTTVQMALDGVVGAQTAIPIDASGDLSLSIIGLAPGVHTLAFSYIDSGQVSPNQAQTSFTVLP